MCTLNLRDKAQIRVVANIAGYEGVAKVNVTWLNYFTSVSILALN
jgi:hypothetical protein